MIKIFKKEDGAVLVLSIIIIAVLMTLITALAGSINSNISFTKRQENDVKAFYAAEAGIEKGINDIRNKNINFINNTYEAEVGINDDLKFEIVITDYRDDSDADYEYKIVSNGYYLNFNKEINVEVDENNKNKDKAVITAGELDNIYNKNQNKTVETYVESHEIVDLDDLPTLDWSSINTDSFIEYDGESNIFPGDKIFSETDVLFEGGGNNKNFNTGGTINSDYTLVISRGDITIKDFTTVYNTIFLAHGNIEFMEYPAHANLENVFMYSENGTISFLREDGNRINPHMALYGQIVSKGDVTIRVQDTGAPHDSGIYYRANLLDNIELPNQFDELKTYTNSKKNITFSNWTEN